MNVGIVSDTHDNVAAVERAVAAFSDRDVDVVLHCGDVIAPPVVPFFDGFELHAVYGNNDGELDGLDRAVRALGDGSTHHGRFAALTLDGVDVAVLHGEDRSDVTALAESGEYDVVCYGHHHEAEVRTVGETTVVNPGAHFPTVPDSERSVAVLSTDAVAVELVSVA